MNKSILKWNLIFQYGYVVTNIINSIILLPFYLKKIDASTLGLWLATGNILAWMTLVDPGVGDILQQKIAELRGKNNSEEIGKTIGSGLVAAAGILLISVIAGFIFFFLIGTIINKDVTQYPNLQMALLITIISTGMSLVSFSVSGINQGLHNASQVAISSILANILFLVINLILLNLEFGVISIAFANLCRALFINIYNFSALKVVVNKENIRIKFITDHFKSFVKIFSFTSLASIIGGLSSSMDTIVLARFISPAMITIFEVNKRPIQLTQSMVGRHSVALMPLVSHARGSDDREGIINLISIQFKYYSYVALFIAIIFCFEYKDLISAWTGTGKYAGNTIVYLLVANFLFGLIGYFMSNMGYALGDIKVNSLVNISRGIGIGILLYVVGKSYGIIGILSVALFGNVVIETLFFTYRLFKLGFLTKNLIKSTTVLWLINIPLIAIGCWGARLLINSWVGINMHVVKIVLNSSAFTLIFIGFIFLTDAVFRSDVLKILSPFNSKSQNTKKAFS